MNAPAMNPSELIASLDPDAIRRRLNEMEAERRGLLALLRVALVSRVDEGQAGGTRKRRLPTSEAVSRN